ncbi:MAG: hypothetical protein J6B34_03765 [Clostridia bacterium]|nr:hypothetical protein [Clostridia bacterium]
MNNKLKVIILAVLMIITAMLVTSCAEDESPYGEYDNTGFTVSVKYDANGGTFTTNTEIIVDSYDISKLPTNSNGNKEIALITPDNAIRGSGNTFVASKSGYFLAGWYQQIAVTDKDGNHLDTDGNIASVSGGELAYEYKRWDFEKGRLELDPSKEYSSKDAVAVLKALWVPQFSYEFYSIKTGEHIGSYVFNPNYVTEISVPKWNMETGAIDMFDFPTVDNMTFDKVYLDSEGKNLVTGEKIAHTGTLDLETATASNPKMNLYVDLREGKWFKISTVEQFIDNSSVSGCYEILADLDFSEKNWKTSLMYGSFKGQIIGNGHTFKNISLEQKDTGKANTGLFGQLAQEAVIKDLALENVTIELVRGTMFFGANFGLLAGTISEGATLENVSISGKLLINSGCSFSKNYTIGLLCGLGDTRGIDLTGISCEGSGKEPEKVQITVDGNAVEVKIG